MTGHFARPRVHLWRFVSIPGRLPAAPKKEPEPPFPCSADGSCGMPAGYATQLERAGMSQGVEGRRGRGLAYFYSTLRHGSLFRLTYV